MDFFQELIENERCKMYDFRAHWHKISEYNCLSYKAKIGLEESQQVGFNVVKSTY